MQITLEYLAGFIDGEGSIIIRKHQNKNKLSHSLILSIGNTNLDILLLIQKYYGGRICKQKKYSENHTQSFMIRWHGTDAQNILNQIKDYLLIKKGQAEIALAFYVGDCGMKVSMKDILERSILNKELRILNKSRFVN